MAIGAESNQGFSEIAFLEYISPIISDAFSLDNIELQQYRNKSKGMRIDGFSYNPIDKTLWGLVVKFSKNNVEDVKHCQPYLPLKYCWLKKDKKNFSLSS